MNRILVGVYFNRLNFREEKSIEEISLGNPSQRQKYRERYLNEEFEKKLNLAIGEYKNA